MTAEYARRHIERGARWGRIVNVSTDGTSGFATEVSYGATKHAMESYSRAAAKELGKYGITVNVVSLGPIQTGWIPEEMQKRIASGPPLGRIGQPEEVADAAVVKRKSQRQQFHRIMTINRMKTKPQKKPITAYHPKDARYEAMTYNRCGHSGLKLPAISLGLWHNFGGVDSIENARAMLRRAFDLGITHFDLANNYGPPPGSAEENFGKIFRRDFARYRDELIISSKAGYLMWPGPYGEWGSRKYLIASLDQSLRRMGLEYVDIFYHHRPDPETPLEETMGALDQIVRSGKALYVGISSYKPEETRRAVQILRTLGTPCLIHQPSYSMFNRWVEDGLLQVLEEEGVGCIVFSPLSQGLLTNRYLDGIPADSRAAKPHGFLKPAQITEEKLAKVRRLNEVAQARGQTLAQMALAWVLRHPQITSALIGASRVSQIEDAAETLKNLTFTSDELEKIETILALSRAAR
jgi:L-glyceraldehyde 3-phosphate reductase